LGQDPVTYGPRGIVLKLDPEAARRLLERIAGGEEAALAELHRVFARRVFAFAMARLRDEAAAQEAVADTFFEIWRHARRFRGESQPSTWMFGIARNIVSNMLRGRRPEMDELDEALPAGDLGAFDELAQKELRAGILRCMETLSAVHRECLYLVFYEGLSLAEVASLQGCPENTVKTRLFHARRNIKDCLDRLREDA
jgi:RNA polymerase sigma-70 factor (ECF subfamily)